METAEKIQYNIENRQPILLLNEVIDDQDLLIKEVLNRPFASLDTDIPVARFRGTMIKKTGNGVKITGWQRNVSRLQKMDVSLPTIISVDLDENYTVRNINLHESFQGSKGLLCNQAYLNKNLVHKLINKDISQESFFVNVQVSHLHCFHITEVLGGIITGIEIMKEKSLDFLFEEEITDSWVESADFHAIGAQKFNFNPDTCYYQLVFKEAQNKFKFNRNGGVFSNDPVDYLFYLNNELKFKDSMAGSTDKRMCLAIKVLCIKAVNEIKKVSVPFFSGNYLSSNLYFQAFIGLLFQAISMKIYYNNLNYVLHTLNSIQRYDNIPQCVGAVDNQEEASKHFPGFDLSKIF